MKLDRINESISGLNGEKEDDADSVYGPRLPSSRRNIAASASCLTLSNRSFGASNSENLRPLPSQMLFIWQTYIENIDSFIKVLYVPTMSKLIYEYHGNVDLLPLFMNPLMFSISFAAIKPLTSEEVTVNSVLTISTRES